MRGEEQERERGEKGGRKVRERGVEGGRKVREGARRCERRGAAYELRGEQEIVEIDL